MTGVAQPMASCTGKLKPSHRNGNAQAIAKILILIGYAGFELEDEPHQFLPALPALLNT